METRQLLLDTAYRAFAERGYGQASVDAIIAEAGLSKGAFYHHFDSKEALFNALIEVRMRDCSEQMAGAVGSSPTLRGAVEGLAHVGIQSLRDDPHWLRLYMEFWLQASRDPVARKMVARSMKQCRDLIADMLRAGQAAGLIRRDLDAAAAAAILNGVFDGVALQAEIDPRAIRLDRMAEPLADLIERFIACPNNNAAKKEVRTR